MILNRRGLSLVACLIASAGCTRQTSTIVSAPVTSSMTVSTLPPGITEAMVTAGDSIFHKGSCQRCHGMDAKGTERGPNLTDDKWSQIGGTYQEIVQVVTSGVPKEKIKMAGAPFAMRPRGGINLTDEQVADVAAYVYTVSHH